MTNYSELRVLLASRVWQLWQLAMTAGSSCWCGKCEVGAVSKISARSADTHILPVSCSIIPWSQWDMSHHQHWTHLDQSCSRPQVHQVKTTTQWQWRENKKHCLFSLFKLYESEIVRSGSWWWDHLLLSHNKFWSATDSDNICCWYYLTDLCTDLLCVIWHYAAAGDSSAQLPFHSPHVSNTGD